jgi:hypothetical protein
MGSPTRATRHRRTSPAAPATHVVEPARQDGTPAARSHQGTVSHAAVVVAALESFGGNEPILSADIATRWTLGEGIDHLLEARCFLRRESTR